MLNSYNIFMGENIAGTATLHLEGLYYRIECVCSVPDSRFYTVEIETEGDRILLGTCVPKSKCYGLTKRIPSKVINGKELTFHLFLKNPKKTQGSIRVRPGQPVPFLAELEHMMLESSQNGVCCFLKRIHT